ncbi:hypothetical protein WICPIJ_006859, partial [Wickerhamomyces pijperi]
AASPPKPALIPKARVYLGASFGLKMLVATTPPAFPIGIPIDAMAIRRDSFGVLLAYHVDVSTDDAATPVVIRKQAKYAGPRFVWVSIHPRTTNPIRVEVTAVRANAHLIFK